MGAAQGFPSSPFWDYTWEVYHRPHVAGVCIELQETYAADVNMLMLSCWLAATGRGVLSVDEWGQSLHVTSVWRNEVVKPLRHVRKHMKSEQRVPAELYQQVLDSEIKAERVEQIRLEQQWQHRPSTPLAVPGQVDVSLRNIVNYFVADELEVNDALKDKLVTLLCGVLAGADAGMVEQAVTKVIEAAAVSL